MLMQLQSYDINLVYKKQSEMYIADALSRAFPPEIVHEEFEDIASERFIHLMSSKSYVTDRKLQAIKDEIRKDKTMQLLILILTELKPYYPYREELTTDDGLIYKSHNILIPPTLQADTLQKLHQSHQGTEKTKRLARESIFWPGMNAQIEELVSNCSTCQYYANANQREPLHPHDISSRPWQKIGSDLFDWNGKPHRIVVDYYSRYPKVAELQDTKAQTVINKTKSIFSRHGIPETVVSDNGPQYSSEEYRQCAKDFNFCHNTISPRYPQSGGLHENTVQTMKNILRKCKANGEDPYLALLDYRKTPINGVTPAQTLMSRRLRSTIPTSQRKLNPKLINRTTFKAARQEQPEQQRKHYDRTAKSLAPLEEGDIVRFRKDPAAPWTRGTVTRKHEAPRSYIVKGDNGTEYRRNRRHLRKTNEEISDYNTTDIDGAQVLTPQQQEASTEKDNVSKPTQTDTNHQVKTSRYGRRINPNPIYKT
ncbi:uncharacterized protein K02A2.6-like [Xenia sp. Carnegie-2017]|uniref:uncharacterized protein K02A2.6-like n=1 Tax=Xenia sp. Carnegie-2017 TaxID=2897299 RepID=UPI001F038A7C|nr:uncharacterized protein K02A2.6-like [Xenia sp. Carnegie-2017]